MRICSHLGCKGRVDSRGLCSRHYKQAQYRGTLDEHLLKNERPELLRCECAFPEPRPLVAFGVEFTDVFECERCHRAVLTREESKARHPSNKT